GLKRHDKKQRKLDKAEDALHQKILEEIKRSTLPDAKKRSLNQVNLGATHTSGGRPSRTCGGPRASAASTMGLFDQVHFELEQDHVRDRDAILERYLATGIGSGPACSRFFEIFSDPEVTMSRP